jgi:hypothetical protein
VNTVTETPKKVQALYQFGLTQQEWADFRRDQKRDRSARMLFVEAAAEIKRLDHLIRKGLR